MASWLFQALETEGGGFEKGKGGLTSRFGGEGVEGWGSRKATTPSLRKSSG